MAMSLIAAKNILQSHLIANDCSSSPFLEALDVAIDAIDTQLLLECELNSFSKEINEVQTKISDELAVFLVQVRDFAKELDFAQASIDLHLSRFGKLFSESREVDK